MGELAASHPGYSYATRWCPHWLRPGCVVLRTLRQLPHMWTWRCSHCRWPLCGAHVGQPAGSPEALHQHQPGCSAALSKGLYVNHVVRNHALLSLGCGCVGCGLWAAGLLGCGLLALGFGLWAVGCGLWAVGGVTYDLLAWHVSC
jgi:hypothetical protein